MPKAKGAAKQPFTTNWEGRDASGAALTRFMERFEKTHGTSLSSTDGDYDVISTGSLNLDYRTGIGGIPTGRIVGMYGPESAGKTTLSMLMTAEAQRKFPNKVCAWLDMEQTFDEEYAEDLGVNLDRLWRPPVRTAEQVADFAKEFVTSGFCSLVTLDSIGGMIAKMEMTKDADEPTVALVANIVTRMVKIASPVCRSNGTTMNIVNQVRAKIDANARPGSVNEPGGWALRHVMSMKFKVARGYVETASAKRIKQDGEDVDVGHLIQVKIEKNKVAAGAGRTANIWFFNQPTEKFGPMGVDVYDEAVTLGKSLGIIKGSNYLTLPGVEGSVNGREKAIIFLREHPEVFEKVRADILGTLGQPLVETEPEDPTGIESFLEEDQSE